jgi:hypothetical protein
MTSTGPIRLASSWGVYIQANANTALQGEGLT